MSQGLRRPEERNRENYPASTQAPTSGQYQGPQIPTGLDDILGEIDAVVGKENLSGQYRQSGGQ